MARIAENTVIVDGQEYKPGDVIPDFKSIKCVDTREPRKYQGLSADVSVLNDVIAKYASGGASCFMSDTGEYYEYDRKEKAWKLITNITERGFDSEKAYGALKHMLKNVTVSDEKIQSAVTNYLTVNPVLPGATTEQAQQIEQNRTDVASLKKETGSLKEDLFNKITKFYASNQGETHIADSDNGKIQDMMIYGKSSQDGTPTPDNPVEIKSVVNPTVKVCGKNLWNPIAGGYISGKDGSITEASKKQIAVTDFIKTNGKDITVIARSFSSAIADGFAYRIGFYNAEKKWIKNATLLDGSKHSINTFNITGTEYIRVSAPSGIYDTIQIEYGSEATPYEPYTEQSVQLPYTLNAIPVTSGSNVTIDGQQYIADYVDVERGKLVRNVENVTFNGAENENWELWNENEDNLWSFMFQNSIKAFVNESASKCNRFEFDANESIDRTFCLCNPSGNPSLQIKNRIIGKDITAFKSWLSNNPIDVIYPLRIPIEEELTAEHAQALKELATYYPVTNISISSEQLDGYTVFNYPISMANGWNYVKKQLNDNRDYIYDMDLQSAEAYVNSEYAVALTELEV